MFNLKELKIRNIHPQDHGSIVKIIPDWWAGRDLSASVLKVFFYHFQNTSFIAEVEGNLTGFLIGFISQSCQNEAFIHFAGVNPDYRRAGIASKLYDNFSDICRVNNVRTVTSCTSPVNTLSIKFHTGIGFKILPGNGKIDNLEVNIGYLRDNEAMVVFQKVL